jgi:iron complex transport system ATP-binding protein
MKLECRNLIYTYPNHTKAVLNGVQFSADPGAFWAILGPNGAGKSTFLKLVSGLLPMPVPGSKEASSSGQVLWQGKDLGLWKPRDLARKVAYVPSVLKNNFSVRVRDFVSQGRFSHQKIWQKPTREDLDKVEESLAYFEVQQIASAPLDEVSSGELQLALLARAFVQNPEVLVLDESMSGVDFSRLANVFRKLQQWNKQKGLTIFWATHDLNLAAEVCQQFAWIIDGRVKFTGPVEQAFSAQQLEQVFGQSLYVAHSPKTQKPQVFLKI